MITICARPFEAARGLPRDEVHDGQVLARDQGHYLSYHVT